jgi:hypothetical protein
MLNKLAAGLIAAALLAAPMVGATASSAEAKTPTAKTKIVKLHRNHLRNYRLVQCYITGTQARHVKLHTGHRLQRVACYLPAKVKLAKVHIRNTARHVVKHVKFVKQARHIKPAKIGHTG